MTRRIERTFTELRKQNKKALVAYITAGDPTLEKTAEIVLGLADAGVDIVEIGVPFSDPVADGPVIQAAARRSLEGGADMAAILDMAGLLRDRTDIPIVLFGYYNPIFAYGPEQFAQRATHAGIDGILVVDLPPEESAELRNHTDRAGIDFISLIAPTTSDERMGMIAGGATGFLYYVAVTGVTGTAKPLASRVGDDMARIRNTTDMPVVVGFGISTPEQAAEIAPRADGIVIGSAIVRLIEEHRKGNNMVTIVARYVKKIKRAMEQDTGNGRF